MRRALTAALAALALTTAGCGGDEGSARLIPEAEAQRLTDLLGRVEQARAAGNCIEARSLNQDAARAADDLPESVDAELRRRIRGGISRIFELLGTQCQEQQQEEEPAVTTEAPVETQAPPTTQTPAPTTEEPDPEPEPGPTTPTPEPTTPAPETPEDPTGGTGDEDETGSTDPGTGGAAAEDEG